MTIADVTTIAVVGSLNIDLIAYAQRVPGPGETVMGDRFAMGFGVKGANQAELKGCVAFICKSKGWTRSN